MRHRLPEAVSAALWNVSWNQEIVDNAWSKSYTKAERYFPALKGAQKVFAREV